VKMLCLIAWGLLGVNGWLPAKVIRVPGQQATIQQAIEKSDPGDIVLVSPGIYRERLRMKPGMTLRSVGEKGANEYTLQFESVVGARYQLETSTDLETFTPVGGVINAIREVVAEPTSAPAANTKRFWRNIRLDD
jgi:hypothetical protein